MKDDLISRQAAIDAIEKYDFDFPDYMERFVTELRDAMKEDLKDDIVNLPSAQPDLNEWCTDCKEYDKEKHSCPRFNRVIRETLKDAELEPCEDAVSRKDAIRWVKTECNPYGKPTLDFESGKKVIEYLERMSPVTPKRKPGHWETYIISMLDREGCRCSECGFDGVPYWDFCPNCGADMRGKQNEH